MKVKDVTSDDSDSTSKKGEIDDPSGVEVDNKLEMIEKCKMSDKLDILTQEVKGMISRGEGEAESEKRKSRLEMILQLLSDEKEESEKIGDQKENMEKAEETSGTVSKRTKGKKAKIPVVHKKIGPYGPELIWHLG